MATSPDPAPDPATAGRSPSSSRDLPEAWGWVLLAAITLGVLLTWLPSLTAALGDNHEGRILARHALNVANAQRDGIVASGWLSDWSPYVGDGGEQTRYAHHPPLLNLGYYLTGRLLPVDLDIAMRVFSYLGGLAMLPLGAAVLRRLGLGWVPTLVATVAVAITPLFWVYGRLSANLALALAMTLAIVRVTEEREIGAGELAWTCVVSVAAIVAGYLGMAMAALLGLWLLLRRGWDRVTVTVGASMTLGAAISLAYVIGRTGADRVGEQVQLRTTGGGFTAAEFVARIAEWATALLPGWWRWALLPAAIVIGIRDPRTRAPVVITTVVSIAYVVGLPNGSFIHDYWILPVLLPVWFGTAALVAALLVALPRSTTSQLLAGAALVTVLVVAGAWNGLSNQIPGRYLSGPEAAGELARAHGPVPTQAVAWRTAGIAAPRWLSLYWDLPPGSVTRGTVDEVPPQDLVMVRLDRAPAWLGTSAELRARAVEVEGGYVLLTGRDLAEAHGS